MQIDTLRSSPLLEEDRLLPKEIIGGYQRVTCPWFVLVPHGIT
jgi:hypothetical protein